VKGPAQSESSDELVLTGGGVYLLAFATVVSGFFDLMWRSFDSAHQPIQAFGDNIPGIEAMACITGVWMVTAGTAVLWRRSVKAGAVALALIYLVFAVFWIPRFYSALHYLGFRNAFIGVLCGMGSQLIVVAAGALLYVSHTRHRVSRPRTILIARWIFGVCTINCGLGHLTDLAADAVYVPKWMPLGREFWVIVTGICFILAGLAILCAILDVLAARLLALMFLIFNALALPQFILANPKDHTAWGGNAYNLATVAASWILADALARRQAERRHNAESAVANIS
jgi:uncharacterized membrane protein